MKFNIDFKKFVIFTVVLIMLFIPTYIAIGNYHANHIDPSQAGDASELTISDPDGRTTTVTSENDPEGLMTMFDSLVKNAEAVSSLPDSVAGDKFLLASYKAGDLTTSYKYYFSTDANACYFTDSNGGIFKIAPASARLFLGSGYSVYLYDNAAPPVLTAGSDNTIVPKNISWYYLVSGDTYQQYTNNSTSDTVLAYDVGSAMNFNFTVEPTECNLKVYNGSVAYYDGPYDKLPPLSITRNTVLTFMINAKWARTDSCEYYGEASYSFNANITAPADFRLGETKIEHGDFVVLSGVNVADPSKVVFHSAPAIDFTPVFYKDAAANGDTVHALIPISYNLAAGTYTFTVSYGVAEHTLTLEVTPSRYPFDERNYNASAALIETNYSLSDVQEYNALYEQICSTSVGTRYFSGQFLDYWKGTALYNDGATLKLGFGKIVTLTNATGRSFVHNGMDFYARSGIDVPTMESGVVSYVGTSDVLGKFVVIDHGYGLKTWYAHLSEISVKAGDNVTKAQSIGKTGNTGFTVENRIHISFTVGNVAVSPYPLWDEGVIFPNFN